LRGLHAVALADATNGAADRFVLPAFYCGFKALVKRMRP
jgi:hypothetical protein